MDSVPKPPNPFAGIDGADSFTVSDLGPLLQQLFFMPGDWLLWSLAAHLPAIARFLEVGAKDYGGLLSGIVSALAWITLLILSSMTYTGIRNFDEALTRRIVDLCAGLRRRARISATLIAYRYRRIRASMEKKPPVEPPQELELSDAEMHLLRVHAELQPGYALAVSEIAAALNVRGYELQRALERLKRLNLLNRTIGGFDDESSYTLTPAGSAFLAFRGFDVARRAERRR